MKTFRTPRRKGQALVEFALVLPLVLTLFSAIAEVGFVSFQDHAVNSACRRGAREASLGKTDAQVRAFVRSQCPNLGIQDGQIAIVEIDGGQNSVTGNPRTPGNDIRVQVVHNLMFLTPIASVFQKLAMTQVRSGSQFVIE